MSKNAAFGVVSCKTFALVPLWDLRLFSISFNWNVNHFKIKAQTKWVYFLTVCTKRKAPTHQHGACQILDDSACGFVFQRAIPKCFSAVLLLCFERTEVPEYFSVLLQSELLFRFFEADSFRFKLSDMGYNFPLFVFVPEAPIFWTFILIHTISCLSLEDKEQNWQLVPPLLVSFSSLLFIIFLTLLVTRLVFVLSPHVTLFLAFFSFTLYSLLSSAILSCAHPHHPSTPLSFTGNLPRVASLPFSSFKLSPPFTTQNPRGRKQEGRNQKGGMKDLREKKEPDLKSLKSDFVPWIG